MKQTKLKKYILFMVPGIVVLCCILAFKKGDVPTILTKPINNDSIANPQYIKRLITYNKVYPFIHYNQNYIEWNDSSSINGLFEKMKLTPTRKLKVLHIGDSHVQADIFTGYIRNELQAVFGDGGRGFVFPYAAAATHAAYDYKTSCKGKWDYSRNIQPYPVYDLGITGATVHTEDSTASFKLIFPSWALKENFNVLKIYCKRSKESFNLKLKTSAGETPLYIDCNSFNDKLYIEVKLPKASDTLEFFVNKTDTAQKSFECYGLLIETSENKGVLYNSVGINGAGLTSILRENLLIYQLSELKPDLVVLDVGLNDFYKVPFYAADIEKKLSNIIDIIQRASPDATIILSDGQDVYYRYWDEGNCKTYAALMREIAFRKGCAFYDYYYVSGGQYSMLYWSANQLAIYDKVHLNAAGYFVRGELFANALLNSYCLKLNKPGLNSLIAAKAFPDTTKPIVQVIKKNVPAISDTTITNSGVKEQSQVWITQTYYYRVKDGDNLGAIAHNYGVTVAQLQTWNSIRGTTITTGQVLTIYKQVLSYNSLPQTTVTNPVIPATTTTTKVKTPTTTTTQTKPTTTTTPSIKGAFKYQVLSGDNLWTIAKRYGTTVDNIKKLNNLTSDALKPGTYIYISK